MDFVKYCIKVSVYLLYNKMELICMKQKAMYQNGKKKNKENRGSGTS